VAGQAEEVVEVAADLRLLQRRMIAGGKGVSRAVRQVLREERRLQSGSYRALPAERRLEERLSFLHPHRHRVEGAGHHRQLILPAGEREEIIRVPPRSGRGNPIEGATERRPRLTCRTAIEEIASPPDAAMTSGPEGIRQSALALSDDFYRPNHR